MKPDERVVFIKKQLNANKSKEEIYLSLLEKKELVDEINESYSLATGSLSKVDTSKRTVQIIVYFGALLIGAGIFSFIASNWSELGSLKKVSVIVIFMIASYAAGWILRQRYKLEKTAQAFFILGSIIYGAGIFLVGQIFHIRADWPDGFILWLLGALMTGFAAQSRAIFYLAIILGIITTIGVPTDIFQGNTLGIYSMTSLTLVICATLATFFSGWLLYRRIPKEYFIHENEQEN